MTRVDVVVFVSIDGVEPLLSERSLAGIPAPFDTRTSLAVLVGGVDVSPRTLDRQAHRVVGGAFGFTLVDTDSVVSNLFQPRQLPKARLAVAVAQGGVPATITVDDTGDFDTAGLVYVGLESFVYSGKTSTTLSVVSRAAYGSPAQSHILGAPVFSAVRSIRQRRVVVYEWDKTTGAITAVARGILDRSPAIQDGHVWRFDARPPEDDLAERLVGQGIRPAALAVTDYNANVLTIQQADAGLFPTPLTDHPYIVALRFKGQEDTPLLLTVTAATSNTITVGDYVDAIDYDNEGRVAGIFARTSRDDLGRLVGVAAQTNNITSVTPVVYLRGDPMLVLLQLLLSYLGGLDNDYDTLQGADLSTDPQGGLRLGAGLSETDLERDVLEAFAYKSPLGWTVYIDEPTPLGPFLNEAAMLVGAFWSIDPETGRLRFDRLPLTTYDTDGSTVTISANQRLDTDNHALVFDDEGRVGRVRFNVGANPLGADSDLAVVITDQRNADMLESPRSLEFSLIWADVLAPQPLPTPRLRKAAGNITTLQLIAQRWLGLNTPTDALVSYQGAQRLTVGSVVTYDNPAMSDGAGGRMDNKVATVEEAGWNSDTRTADGVLRISERGRVLAPSALVVSVSTTTVANDTLGLAPASVLYDDEPPANNFAVGWSVVIWDGLTAYTRTVAAILSGTSIRLSTGVSITPTGSTWMTLGDYDSTVGNTTENTRETPLTLAAFAYLCDGANTLGTVADPTHRWGA